MLLLIWEFQWERLKESEIYLTSNRTGSCSTYATILNEQLCTVVSEFWEILPDAGEIYFVVACIQRNTFVQC